MRGHAGSGEEVFLKFRGIGLNCTKQLPTFLDLGECHRSISFFKCFLSSYSVSIQLEPLILGTSLSVTTLIRLSIRRRVMQTSLIWTVDVTALPIHSPTPWRPIIFCLYLLADRPQVCIGYTAAIGFFGPRHLALV